MLARPARSAVAICAATFLLLNTGCAARFDRPAAGTEQSLSGEGGQDQGGVVLDGSGNPVPGPAASGRATQGPALGGSTSGGGTSGGSSGGSTTGGSTGTSGGTTTGTSGGPVVVERGSTIGVTDTQVKIGVFVPKTGAAPVPPTIDAQAQNYWDFVKRKVGGIFGRNVTVKIYDTKSTEADARTAVQQAVADGIFAAVSLDRISVEGKLVTELANAKIPHLINQMPAAQKIPDDAFYIGTNQVNNGRQIANYMAHKLKVKRVGFVGETDPTAYPARDAFVAEAKRLGLQVVHNEVVDGMSNEFLAESQKLANDNAESVWMYVAPNNAINIAVESRQNGYRPVWVSSSIAWGFNLVLTPANGALDGAKAFSPWGGLSDPRYATFLRENDQGRTSQDKDIGLPSWGYGQIIAAAMKAAGPNLGRNSFRHAMQNLKLDRTDVVTGAPLCWAPLDFTGGKRYGSGDRTIVMTVEGSGAQSVWKTESDYRSVY